MKHSTFILIISTFIVTACIIITIPFLTNSIKNYEYGKKHYHKTECQLQYCPNIITTRCPNSNKNCFIMIMDYLTVVNHNNYSLIYNMSINDNKNNSTSTDLCHKFNTIKCYYDDNSISNTLTHKPLYFGFTSSGILIFILVTLLMILIILIILWGVDLKNLDSTNNTELAKLLSSYPNNEPLPHFTDSDIEIGSLSDIRLVVNN